MTIGLITLIATLIISLLVTRIGAVALTLTGLAPDVARFQARSAYTGVGFTTGESEKIVNHPVRRRVVAYLMLTGNIGIAVVIASMMATFAAGGGEKDPWEWYLRVGGLFLALGLLWFVGTRTWVDQAVERMITWALRNWTDLDVQDYVSLLNLGMGHMVVEITVLEGDWIAEKTLADSRLAAEGVLVLGIHRVGGEYVGSPSGITEIHAGDVLAVYGPIARLKELDLRKSGWQGDQAHQKAVAEHQSQSTEEEAQDPDSQPNPAVSGEGSTETSS